MSFCLSFHLARLGPTGAHWLDDPPEASCRDSTGEHAVDDPLLSCNSRLSPSPYARRPALAAIGLPRSSARARLSSACSPRLPGVRPQTSRRLAIPLAIRSLQRGQPGGDWPDGGPNATCSDAPRAHQADRSCPTSNPLVAGSSWGCSRSPSAGDAMAVSRVTVGCGRRRCGGRAFRDRPHFGDSEPPGRRWHAAGADGHHLPATTIPARPQDGVPCACQGQHARGGPGSLAFGAASERLARHNCGSGTGRWC
jgi:hypothetical protein